MVYFNSISVNERISNSNDGKEVYVVGTQEVHVVYKQEVEKH